MDSARFTDSDRTELAELTSDSVPSFKRTGEKIASMMSRFVAIKIDLELAEQRLELSQALAKTSQKEADLAREINVMIAEANKEVARIRLQATCEIDSVRAEAERVRIQIADLQLQKEAAEKEIADLYRQQTVDFGSDVKWVTLNVGGSVFRTTVQTLTSIPGTYFSAMFRGGFVEGSGQGTEILIDRNGQAIPLVLDYLRGVKIDDRLREISKDGSVYNVIKTEFQFYCLPFDFAPFDRLIRDRRAERPSTAVGTSNRSFNRSDYRSGRN
jgi:phage host-nuclease inhibitor protein Gam